MYVFDAKEPQSTTAMETLPLQQIPSLLRGLFSHGELTQAQHPGPQGLDLDCPLLLGSGPSPPHSGSFSTANKLLLFSV